MTSSFVISIITPSYNRAAFVQTAIESVLSQNYGQIEHIIVDGGSTDNTIRLLTPYSHLHVVSESDRGVYDALNKGVQMAKGEIIGQLNTDDHYQTNIFKSIVDAFQNNPHVDAVCGFSRVYELDPKDHEHDVALYEPVNEKSFPARVTTGAPIINAWFFRRRVFEQVGNYCLRFPLSADRDFLIRCYLDKINIMPLDLMVYHYRQHSDSLTIRSPRGNNEPLLTDNLKIAQKFLRYKNLNYDFKKCCLQWHDLTVIELLIIHARRKNIMDIARVLKSAIAHNPWLPFIVARQSPVRTINYLKKRYASKN